MFHRPGTGLEVLSNYCKEPLTLDTVFPYQKSYLIPNCMMRMVPYTPFGGVPASDVIRPNVPALKFVNGSPKLT
jgi:hypothetical protein